MGLGEFFRNVWDFVCSSFEDCTSCCDVLDPDYYRKTSPGVRRTPQMFNRWDNDVKYDFGGHPPSRAPSSLPPASSSPVGRTLRSFTSPSSMSGSAGSSSGSASRSQSPSSYSYEEEDERQVQFLFYGGSDPPTPTSGTYPSGYRSDMISKYVQPVEPASPAFIASPRINHEMPCFFSPRTTPTSPMSAPIYSPHLFRITEQRTRNTEYYRRYTSR